MRVLDEIIADAEVLSHRFHGEHPGVRQWIKTMSYDGAQVLLLSRLRDAAQRHRVPVFGAVARRTQTALFGVEISRDARLGKGVLFLHTVGIVIGGDSQVGDRVVFFGGNTLGRLDDSGYPRIGNDVAIGAGARILGAVTIGDGASIGANAVVLSDVPAGATAAGVPAVVRQRASRTSPSRVSDP